MTELKHDEVIPSIIAAAVAAAGPKGSNEGQWKAKVNDAIPHIASMIHDGSRQWNIAAEVLNAAVFVATYVDHKVEESSTRVLVHIDTGKATKNYPDGIEPIRTHRTDNAQGRSMKERLDKLSAGDEMVVWKSIEASDDGNEKYRVLVHFETRPKRTSPGGAAQPPATREQQSDHAPAAAPAPYTDAIDTERLTGWRHATREALTSFEFDLLDTELKRLGFDFDGVSEIEWDEYVRPAARNIINQRGT